MRRLKSKLSILNIFITLISVFIVTIIVFGFVIIRAINISLEAENRSWATANTCTIIKNYITQSDPPQWPRSWDDLATIELTDQHPYWPKERVFYEENVFIDFEVTLDEIASSTPTNFNAVQPIGPHYWHAEMNFHILIELAQQIQPDI